jgi:predicted tellurium resistance membrane protein TerC
LSRPIQGRRNRDTAEGVCSAWVIAADIVVSLDNIVALVSVSRGSATLLILGLLMSVPALMYGSFVATRMLEESPGLVTIGAVFLGWIAGQTRSREGGAV